MVHSDETVKFQYNYVVNECNAVLQLTLRCQMSVLPTHGSQPQLIHFHSLANTAVQDKTTKLTVSDVRSSGSRDILATARVESLPTMALYGASFP